MDEFFSMGALIPLWILCAGLALGVAMAARGSSRDEHEDYVTAPAHRHHTAPTARPASQRQRL